MDKGYEQFCFSDPVFYDSVIVSRGDDVDWDIASSRVSDGWKQDEVDDWLVYRPEERELARQGWKIHVSACLDNAERVLAITWDYCVKKRLPFKFIRSQQYLFLRNAKYADRGASGKFITIYPEDEAELERVLTELGEILDGEPGPYILSDLRWGDGPLYVRYGGFREMYCVGADGDLAPAIADDNDELVPDRRDPTFYVPPWVTLPSFLEPHLAARAGQTLEDIPYTIERPLHFSNGGGVYSGVDERSGEKVVLKEARPHAGLATDKADAIARLARERETLERLAGLGVVPELRDHFTVGDHHFIVQEYVDGATLSAEIVDRYPLTSRDEDRERARVYSDWAVDTYSRLERAVDAVHARGVVIGDFHPSNVLVKPDGNVVLIDLETASLKDEPRGATLGDPSFMAPRGTTGLALDRYALARLRIFLFMPLTSLLNLEPLKVEELAAEIAAIFPVPQEFLAEAVSALTKGVVDARPSIGRPPLGPEPDAWPAARDSMARAILASATPDRDDRLFPGDPMQFEIGALGIAYGAAGVLHALDVTGVGRYPEHEEWLIARALRPEPGTRLGLYDGLHGVAHVLERLDRRDEALQVMAICAAELDSRLDRLGQDLRSGLAGVGLNLLHFEEATADRSFLSAAQDVAAVVVDRLGDVESVPEISGGKRPYAGLVRGSAGVALFLLRLYERTGDSSLLDAAATALRQDLRRCVPAEDDALEVNEGWRTMPYLADGSVGIGWILDEYLAHRHEQQFAEAATKISRAAEGQFYIEPGVFWGRAGMILYLCRRHSPGAGAADPVIAGHIRRLGWHALSYQDHLAFPGEQLLRLSMDLATGTAGVLLALGAACHEGAVHLPFLAPRFKPGVAPPLGDRELVAERR